MKHLQRLLSVFLSFSLIMLPIVSAQAAVVGNSELFGSSLADRTLLIKTLERDSVKQQLSTLGLSPEQAAQRVSQMTEQEIAQLNQRLADLPAGGDVLGILVLLFIVFIITDAIGATDIFSFVHPVR